MLDHAIGPNVIKGLLSGMQAFLEKHADKGWHSLDDFRGLRRDRIVAHHEIKRPEAKEYHGGQGRAGRLRGREPLIRDVAPHLPVYRPGTASAGS